MKTYIYKSTRKEELYLYITEKDDFSNVPQALFDSMGKEPVYVMELELSANKPLAREDVTKVMENLSNQGFHVQMPPAIQSLMEFKTPPKLHS